MRIVSKLFLLAATIVAAMAFGASAANASSAIEVSEEATGIHCSVAAGNCVVHVVGESRLEVGHPGGFIVSACNDEFDASFNEDGSGVVTNATLVDKTAGSCNSIPCAGVDWPISGAEEVAAGRVEATVTFCLNDGQICAADVFLDEVGLHAYEFSTETLCPSGVTVIGHWTAETSNIEIAHL